MISKPPGDWAREDRTVDAARQFGSIAYKAVSAGTSGVVRSVAIVRAVGCALMAFTCGWAALGAGLIGRNLPVGILAGCFSLFAGWMALRNARKAFGHTRSSLAGPEGLPETARLSSPQGPWSNGARVARDSGINTAGGVSAICYDRKKLFLRVGRLFLTCAVLCAALMFSRYRGPLVGSLVLIVLGYYFLTLVMLVLRASDKDLTAISWDDRQIRFRTLTSSRQVPWQSVEAVGTKRTVRRLYGVIKVSTTYELVVRLRNAGRHRKITIRSSLLAIGPEMVEALIRKGALRQTQMADNDAGAGDRPVFGEKKMEAQPDFRASEQDAVPALDAEPTRTFGAYDGTAMPPRVFGRKVV